MSPSLLSSYVHVSSFLSSCHILYTFLVPLFFLWFFHYSLVPYFLPLLLLSFVCLSIFPPCFLLFSHLYIFFILPSFYYFSFLISNLLSCHQYFSCPSTFPHPSLLHSSLFLSFPHSFFCLFIFSFLSSFHISFPFSLFLTPCHYINTCSLPSCLCLFFLSLVHVCLSSLLPHILPRSFILPFFCHSIPHSLLFLSIFK